MSSGDVRDKLRALFERFYPFVFARARTLLRNDADAEEVAGDVFLRLTKSLQRDPRLELTTRGMYTIATHACIDKWRARQRRRELLTADMTEAPVAEVLPSIEGDVRVTELLALVAPDDLPLVIFHLVDGLTIAEIHRVTGRSERTIRRRLKKAKDKVAAIVLRERSDPAGGR